MLQLLYMIRFNFERPKSENTEIHDFEGYEKIDFPTWKSIEIGTGIKTGDEFVDMLKSRQFLISKNAETLLKKTELTEDPGELHLVRVTPRDLGFKEMPSIKAMNQRALELGLKLCPAEVGPYLRAQYTDQPKNTWLHIGMNPAMVKDYKDREYSITFVLIEEDGLVLHSSYNENVQLYDLDSSFVFLKSEDK